MFDRERKQCNVGGLSHTVDYVVYHHSRWGWAILDVVGSTDKALMLLGDDKNRVDVLKMSVKEFDAKNFLKAEWRGRLMSPASAAALMFSGRPTKAALEKIEEVIVAETGFETKGKNVEQISTEIKRISEELPEGHSLRGWSKKFTDRGQAIAHLTAVKQALFQLNRGVKSMAEESKSTETGAAATKGKSKAAPKGKPAKEAKGKPAKANGEAKKEAKPAKEKKTRASTNVGPFKLSDEAAKVKSPEELGMHEGSARYKLMEVMYKNKSVKGVSLDTIKEAVGDQTTQAVAVCIKLGRIVAVA